MQKMIRFVFSTTVLTALTGFAMEEVEGATVLPVFYEDGIRKVLISEENVKGSPFFKTYEGWGGGFDARWDENALDTAAREFWEEALLQHTLELSLEDTRGYLKSERVETIVKTHEIPKFFPKRGEERTKPIFVYIVRFELSDIEKIRQRFFKQLRSYLPTEDNFRFREKGNLAVVEWDRLVQSIREPDLEIGSSVEASVYDKESDSATVARQETIPLRSIIVACLRDHFLKYSGVVDDQEVHEYQCTIPD